MYALMIPFTISRTTLTRNVNESKMELVKTLGIEDFELWKCPEEYIHLLNTKKTIMYTVSNNYAMTIC